MVVGDEVLRCVEVVDDLRDEEPATRLLLGQEAQMLILAPAVALGDRDAAQLERRVGVPAQRLGVGERRSVAAVLEAAPTRTVITRAGSCAVSHARSSSGAYLPTARYTITGVGQVLR